MVWLIGASRTPTTGVRDERGSASVQLVVLLPILIGIVFLALQGGLSYYGRTAALAAAETGARAVAAENGTTSQCQAAAGRFLEQVGDALTSASVTCTRTGTTVTVEVRGQGLSVVTGWQQTITQSATLPVERITG